MQYPGSLALNALRGSAGVFDRKASRLLTPWRRKQRSRPERETSGFARHRQQVIQSQQQRPAQFRHNGSCGRVIVVAN
jgi:hypothetical protein